MYLPQITTLKKAELQIRESIVDFSYFSMKTCCNPSLELHTAWSLTHKVNSLTTEKQTTKFSSANFQKMLSPSYIILRIQGLEGKQSRSR